MIGTCLHHLLGTFSSEHPTINFIRLKPNLIQLIILSVDNNSLFERSLALKLSINNQFLKYFTFSRKWKYTLIFCGIKLYIRLESGDSALWRARSRSSLLTTNQESALKDHLIFLSDVGYGFDKIKYGVYRMNNLFETHKFLI